MARNRTVMTEKAIATRVQKGYGLGFGKDYQAWFKAWEVPSQGRASRIKSWSVGRVVHLLSKLELYVFYILQWYPYVVNIREQFPLVRPRTVALAKQLGLKHSCYPETREPIVMTTDFLATFEFGLQKIQVAYDVKYQKDAAKCSTQRKLQLAAAYWNSLPRKTPHIVVTEKMVPSEMAQNVEFIYHYRDLKMLSPLTIGDIKEIEAELTPGVRHQRKTLVELCDASDKKFRLLPGTTLKISRHLLANNRWPIDWSVRIVPRRPLVLSSKPIELDWLPKAM